MAYLVRHGDLGKLGVEAVRVADKCDVQAAHDIHMLHTRSYSRLLKTVNTASPYLWHAELAKLLPNHLLEVVVHADAPDIERAAVAVEPANPAHVPAV